MGRWSQEKLNTVSSEEQGELSGLLERRVVRGVEWQGEDRPSTGTLQGVMERGEA